MVGEVVLYSTLCVVLLPALCHAQYDLRAYRRDEFTHSKCIAISSTSVLTAKHSVTYSGLVYPVIQVDINGWKNAKLKFVSKTKDIAILEVDGITNFTKISLDNPKKGDIIQTMRSSGKFGGTFDSKTRLDWALMDIGIERGDSGGPVLNTKGELIGIINSYTAFSNRDVTFVNAEGIRNFVRKSNE